MGDSYIQLSLGGFSVTCLLFLSESFPRIFGEFTAPSFTANNSLIQPGNPYGEPEQWQFQAVLTKAECLTLRNLYREHRRLNNARLDSKILLIDTVSEFEEVAPRTRATAASPFDTVTTTGGYVSYFARFYAVFQAAPEFEYWANGSDGSALWSVNLSLIEAGGKVAP
ncbi:hypothetical protein AB3R30_19855 [Leptolyngbyaceae cyanobacterium UHCC 1019]